MTQKQAQKRLNQMTLDEVINLWNESAMMYERILGIHRVTDTKWWDYLANELGGITYRDFILGSTEDFKEDDEFFFCDEESGILRSFSTKEELLDILGEDYFINELENQIQEQPQTINKYGRIWEEVEGVLLDDYWLVGNFEGVGQIYMDNVKGAILLIEEGNKLWKSDI